MKTAIVLSLLCLPFGLPCGQEKDKELKATELGKPEPSPIPEKLTAEAKKAFDRKMVYFIWTEEEVAKSNGFQLKFAINPKLTEEAAVTVARFFYTQIESVSPKDGSKQRLRARVTSAGEGVRGMISNEIGVKGMEDVTYFLIKSSDAKKLDWNNLNSVKVVPISNSIVVRVTFEVGGGPAMLQPKVVDVGEPETASIPDKLQAEANKAFAKKLAYFIWSDEKTPKAKDFQLKFTVNPDLKEDPGPAFTVAKLTYTAPPEFGSKKSRRVPFTSTGEGIKGMIPSGTPDKFKGKGDVTYYLIKASDAIGPDGTPKLNPEKATPISNTIVVKLTFE